MKNYIKLTIYINAILIYLILFYSTCLYAETFKENYYVDLDVRWNIITDVGLIKIDTHDEAIIELSVKI